MNWSLLPTISAPMPLQMVLDELLFESQKKELLAAPTLRFYVSSGPWISAGYSFRNSKALLKSEMVLRNSRVPVCRRVTGGGCVSHGGDLIFSLVARMQTDLERLGSVRTSYAKIHESVRMALQECGLDPKFYCVSDDLPKGNDCFHFPVESDLSWRGKKIAGGAQKRSEGVLLHQESIMFPKGVKMGALITAICKGFERVFGVMIESTDLDPEIFFKADKSKRTEAQDFGVMGEIHGRSGKFS